MEYKYTPLKDPLDLRLLSLKPAILFESPLECHLRITNLWKGEEFEALSYTWGDGNLNSRILINGARLGITANLESFLRHRRESCEEVMLWVDSVCINQTDNEERNKQVSEMSIIYFAATRLTIWLGPASDDSDVAMKELQGLSCATPFLRLSTLDRQATAAIKKLLDRSWWTRVWIVQELCWGAGGPFLLSSSVKCGEHSINWGHLVVACARIKFHQENLRVNIEKVEKILQLEALRGSAVQLATQAVNGGFDLISILELIAEYRHFEATDPRDKIYALMSMVMSRQDSTKSVIRIDYGSSTKKIYEEFAMKMLLGAPGLEVLRHCQTRVHENDDGHGLSLPSWVPDWSLEPTELPIRIALHRKERGGLPWWIAPVGDRKSGWKYSGDQDEIKNRIQKVIETSKRSQRMVINPKSSSFMDVLHPSQANMLHQLMTEGKLIVAGLEDFYTSPRDSKTAREAAEDVMDANELRMQADFASEWIENQSKPSQCYQAAGKLPALFNANLDCGELTVQGISWDRIMATNEPFVGSLGSDWTNSTQFIVAIGRCKRMAMMEYGEPNPYGNAEGRIKAFWDAILAGQTTETKEYCTWLPERPNTWTESEPPLTFLNHHRLEIAETTALMKKTFVGMESRREVRVEYDDDGEGLYPSDWSKEEQLIFTSKFRELGKLWMDQPYDLYHRPFNLPTVVPDPFWECRRKLDKRALAQSSRVRRDKLLEGMFADKWTETIKSRKQFSRALENDVSLAPQAEELKNLEQYALNRRFFVTDRGYFGIGPMSLNNGDHVAVFTGLSVPVVLRPSGLSRFKLIGETYVAGLMFGEAMQQWGLGNTEFQTFVVI